MRYNPSCESYYKYVGGEGKGWQLTYHVMGDDLVLFSKGENGDNNIIVLDEVSWDKIFLYSSKSRTMFQIL